MMSDQTQPVIIFDGVCNLCSGAVNFVIKRDVKKHFRFSPLQSRPAQALMAEHKVSAIDDETFLLIKNGQCFVRTGAALEITKDLDGYWYVLRGFTIVPRFIRDVFYRLLAKHRYRWFGRCAVCRIPAVDDLDRFLL